MHYFPFKTGLEFKMFKFWCEKRAGEGGIDVVENSIPTQLLSVRITKHNSEIWVFRITEVCKRVRLIEI